MKRKLCIIAITFFIQSLFTSAISIDKWFSEKHKHYIFHYTESDKQEKAIYIDFIDKGINTVCSFFQKSYDSNFNVYIHPNRLSFDSTLQKDNNNPKFKSECWLVATGDAYAINIFSPKRWDNEPCTAGRYCTYSDKFKTQKLITHELVHVFHGQKNINHSLENNEHYAWFIEGVAYYASNQIDSIDLKKIKTAFHTERVPKSLRDISTLEEIDLRYAILGSIAMFIDKKYGRIKLSELLAYNTKAEILLKLNINEFQLLNEWKNYLLKYNASR